MAKRKFNDVLSLNALRAHQHRMLNRFLDGEGLVTAVQKRPGIYGPNPIAYLSLVARRSKIRPADIDECILNDRSLVRAGGIRGALSLMATEDFSLYNRAFFNLLKPRGMRRLTEEGFDEKRLYKIQKMLESDPFELSLSTDEIFERILSSRERKPVGDVSRLLMKKLCDLGVLIRTSSRGWKGNTYNYAMMKTWFPDFELRRDQGEAARVEVVRRYFRLYGPAYPEDAAHWTGFTLEDINRYIAQMGREAVRYQVNGMPEGLIGSKESIDSLRRDPESYQSIVFLPVWDYFSTAWKTRGRIIREEFEPWIVDNNGNTTSLIVENGRAIGVWQFRDGDNIIMEFHIFQPYANRLNSVRLAAESHGKVLAKLTGAKDVEVYERALPQQLSERKPGSFLWPLGKDPIQRFDIDLPTRSPMDRRSDTIMRSKFLDDKTLMNPEPTKAAR